MSNNTDGKLKFPEIKNIIAVASGKGGVGKSTVSAEIAKALAKKGYKTGIFDADIYGPSIPILFGLEDYRPEVIEMADSEVMNPAMKDGIQVMSIGFLVGEAQPLIWRGPAASGYLKQLIQGTVWTDLDYLVIDLPPGTGDIALTLCQEIPLTGAVIVTTPQKLAVADVQKSVNMFKHKDLNIPIIGIVENMSYFTPENHKEDKYYLFGKGGGELLAQELDTELIAQIPMIEGLCDANNISCSYNSFELSPAVQAQYAKIADKIVAMPSVQNASPEIEKVDNADKAPSHIICIPTEEQKGLNSMSYGHFGSAPTFIIYDMEAKTFEYIINNEAEHEHGQCNPIQPLKEKGVDTVVVAGMGGRALENLQSMGIKVFQTPEPMRVYEIISLIHNQELAELSAENCCQHHNCH